MIINFTHVPLNFLFCTPSKKILPYSYRNEGRNKNYPNLFLQSSIFAKFLNPCRDCKLDGGLLTNYLADKLINLLYTVTLCSLSITAFYPSSTQDMRHILQLNSLLHVYINISDIIPATDYKQRNMLWQLYHKWVGKWFRYMNWPPTKQQQCSDLNGESGSTPVAGSISGIYKWKPCPAFRCNWVDGVWAAIWK